MTKFSKSRLETFSDGVMAIIITIMVLDIPLPEIFGFKEIMRLLSSILIFFVSFFIVGSHWNKHHNLFDIIHDVSNKIIWRNFLFLFFLSLIPIFTKWVMQNPDEIVPIIGYDLLYLLVNISYKFIWSGIIHEKGNEDIKNEIDQMKADGKFSVLHFTIMIAFLIVIIIVLFSFPRISLILFIGFPVGSSLLNLLFENNRHTRDQRIASRQNTPNRKK
ncbi:MAG: Integral rane protein [Herbinix sp.]|jgi:uncharacterized membrane protein|nr:Integral rane protein [Herbinix sp.]